jgi:large subunit ribosomal protein L3
MTALVGAKGYMSQIYSDEGIAIPATAVEVGKCVVVAIRTKPVDGYEALQIGFGSASKATRTKPALGHFKKAGVEPTRVLVEVKADKVEDYKVGQQLGVDVFQPGDKVSVTGTTIGRGFAGGVRRWGWHGGPDTHGSNSHRRIGSLGSGSSPGRVLPGRTLPGHYGCERVTVRGLKIVKVEPDKGTIYVSGAIPGHRGSVVVVRKG